MHKFYIQGPTELKGEVLISGSKNSALPILFASLLTDKPVEIRNIPNLKDVDITIQLLHQLGAKVESDGAIFIDASTVNTCCVSHNLVKSIRASIWILAPLLARFGYGEIFLPGGCSIGKRPVDLHIHGLQKLGAHIQQLESGYIKASVNGRLRGAHIVMEKISVGATVSIMSAATLAEGITVIENAAREPEVIDTANFLITLGTHIVGAGSDKIIIKGVRKLGGGSYYIIPDRIETGTFLVAAAISRGDVICRYSDPLVLENVLIKLYEAGAKITIGNDWIRLNMFGRRPKAVSIRTSPYPGFPTDMQAQFSLLNVIAEGNGVIVESVFENRFMHIQELVRMGAKVYIQGNMLVCYGVNTLVGTHVMASDLRGSASLVLAGCIAEGLTTVHSVHHIDRGYDCIDQKLCNLGAYIDRVFDE
ncbi:UDP-N-acetylglucosamine 1-carboxyvinyltransferase [Blochmannia endosymbiont of Polyrhachis (Hedomyrma) turneri]|uniref:UDP-N-acetylglucosamine 1-carboxyvinyltransferase n=1 Tax=Blochmannia endosymbiont of Polyrhachis (Hedomyrma) turneri TaxID=1505596 RepID=UPI00061A5A25|nr:UDP-N-acetylglucosamine 1-carboxyvinyltransferase [Blochmannia endosymbiont of Polyrhachis (Hedomyrma) turneri]AKC59639.1 UDP-N-acetylglucosamine 1-carboxyvinyltransferase [Blochmannia endosymbiont of Polyrhachis (Hedomyrma) turneri]